MWRALPAIIILSLFALVLWALPTPSAGAGVGPSRSLEYIEGRGLRCVLATNTDSSMASSGALALWCDPLGRVPTAQPFVVVR